MKYKRTETKFGVLEPKEGRGPAVSMGSTKSKLNKAPNMQNLKVGKKKTYGVIKNKIRNNLILQSTFESPRQDNLRQKAE